MKKLFTLFAFLACFLGAKAVTVVDAEVDFSKYTDISEVRFYSWGGTKDRLSIQDGCLRYHSEEATENPWDQQFFPIGGVDVEIGVTYTFTMKIKGSVEGPIFNCSFAGVDKYGATTVPTDWDEIMLTYEATSTSGDLLFQCGSYVGDLDIAWMKITHEERDQRPVQWQNILVNGDAEGEYGEPACVQSKEFGENLDEKGQAQVHTAEITTEGGNKVFVCHAKAVNPPLLWDEDGEQWGTPHNAGDPMPDNAWQNQFWIVLPRAAKDGEQFKLSFKYKAAKAAKADTQDHRLPGDYLGGGTYGQVSFTTEWQTYEKQFSAAADMQSIAFNLGTEIYNEDIDFFLDDVKVEEMVLDHGLFVASTHTTSGLVDYDFDNAVEFTWDDETEAYVATVGKKGDQDSWVNEVMISTVRGNDKAFKAATLKCNVTEPEAWINYEESSNAKIKLLAAGVWTISVDMELGQMYFEQVEGEKIEIKDPIEINANPTVVVVNAPERDENGNPWDSQFWIAANRELSAGEVTVVEFDYLASAEAKTTTQCHGDPGNYMAGACIGDVMFTTEEQHFSQTFTIEADGMKSIAFNMAEILEACNYTIKNIVWKLADNTESLIDQTGTKNFFVKEGADNPIHEFGTEVVDGIDSVVITNNASAVIYNIAGLRVSNEYKGLVVKNGKKYLSK